jgi:hypothetical protein
VEPGRREKRKSVWCGRKMISNVSKWHFFRASNSEHVEAGEGGGRRGRFTAIDDMTWEANNEKT